MLLRVLSFVLVARTLISPAVAGDLTTSNGQPVRTVAVISRLGDGVNIVQPPTVFSNHRARRGYLPLPGWKIDERIEQRISQSLAARFTVTPLTAVEVATRGSDSWTNEDAVENLRKWGLRPEIDAYVLVVTAVDGDDFANSDETFFGDTPLYGLGFYRRDDLLVWTYAVYAVYDVLIVDSKTGGEIARQRGRVDGAWNYAGRYVYGKFWTTDDRLPQGDEIPPIRDAVTALVDESVDWTLRKLRL